MESFPGADRGRRYGHQALEFLAANRSSLFAGVPIVFYGVDDYSPDMLKGQTDITGVTGDP